jgi:tRNA-guanine family transglycosylase
MASENISRFPDLESETRFTVEATAGDARVGELSIGDRSIETPNLFPVINFYAGGTRNSLYGGGIHRTIKEFMIESDKIGDGNYSEYFDAAMTSVSSLTDYGINKNRFDDYIDTKIRDRSEFAAFDGILFLDSGGFKFLGDGTLDGSDFEVEINQKEAYNIQRQLGGDILVNLDRPITPDDSPDDRIEKAQQTAQNVAAFLRYSADHKGARYLTVHGYNYSMIDRFMSELSTELGPELLRRAFDGIALGSLVPKKDNKDALIDAVSHCREVLAERGFRDLPLHVLGISSSSIPLLVAMGVDTFDSSSYLHSAINGKYDVSLMSSTPIEDASFDDCPYSCPVCEDEMLRSRMRGNTQYRKDELGPVAIHNLIVQKEELGVIRERICEDGADGLKGYIESTIGRDKSMRQAAHRVVNESLGGYF